MVLHGIATALTGSKENPSFHCSVVSVDPSKLKTLSDKEKQEFKQASYRQRFLARELPFKTPSLKALHNDFKFSKELKTPSDVKEATRKFTQVLGEVIELQASDKRTKDLPVQVVLGQDIRQGEKYYPWRNLLRNLGSTLKNELANKVTSAQFHYGTFTQNGKPEDASTKKKRSKDDQHLELDRFILKKGTKEERKVVLEYYQERASRDADDLLVSFGMARFYKNHEPMRLRYLALDPEIERTFIDKLRLLYASEANDWGNRMHHFYINYGSKRNPPFFDLVKTHLLDQIAGLEDGYKRFEDKFNKAIQKRVKQAA